MELSQEKGASTWLTALPIDDHGYALHKSAFKNALALRYGWMLQNPPSHCSCSQPFSIEHALKMGGFPAVRHNDVRDITASLLSEVCHGVTTEPQLQQLSGKTMSHHSGMVLVWMLLCMVSGEADLRRHFWMSGCLTLVPNQIDMAL